MAYRRPQGSEGRVFFVTGASSGIGLATAEELASRGATVVLACRSEERGLAAVAKLRRSNPDAVAHLVLLRSEEHTSELQSHSDLVCRLLLEKKKTRKIAASMIADKIGHVG